MRRIGGDLDERAAEEVVLGTESGDHVPHRQLELIDRERARAAEAHDSSARAHELIEPAKILGGHEVGVLGPDAAAAAGASTAATAARTALYWNACVLGEDQDVDFLAQRRTKVDGPHA